MKLICKAILGLTLAAVGFLIPTPRANAAPTVSTADNDFILAAIQGGMTELRLGEMAVLQGKRDDVKEFGQKMVKEEASLTDDFKALAVQKGVTVPVSLDVKHQGMVDKMVDLRGSEFDNAYIAGMTKHQTEVAKEFRAESAATKDADVKSVVDKSMLVVNEHLKRITAMNE
jgi:putative membrane protein